MRLQHKADVPKKSLKAGSYQVPEVHLMVVLITAEALTEIQQLLRGQLHIPLRPPQVLLQNIDGVCVVEQAVVFIVDVALQLLDACCKALVLLIRKVWQKQGIFNFIVLLRLHEVLALDVALLTREDSSFWHKAALRL